MNRSFLFFFPRLSELDIAQLDREITKKEKPIGKLFSLSCCRRGAIKFLILFSLKKKTAAFIRLYSNARNGNRVFLSLFIRDSRKRA